ncbi:MAG: insulinase family protein [Phycisphaera sp.]|nr:insulinase family protein [Phycisphaera sp.]
MILLGCRYNCWLMVKLFQHRFPNGLWLVGERLPNVQSLAVHMLVPAGVCHEPAKKLGVAQVLSEMVNRGAGDYDARQHSDALDMLGLRRDTGVDTRHARVSAVMIGGKVDEALPLLVDMIRRPTLDKAHLEPSVDLALQALDSLEDEPQQKVFLRLRKRHLPEPFGRTSMGERSHLEGLKIEDVRSHWHHTHVPGGALFAFAGRFDWDKLKAQVEALTGDWSGENPEPAETKHGERGYFHEVAQSTQVHIGLAYDAPPEVDPRSMEQRIAIAALSGGMSGRLFTEVREKRGLCYSVFANYAADRRRGLVLAYSGTTAARAQETLDVLSGEMARLSRGIEQDEFARAVVGMKSSLVMQGESTGARAGAIAMDQYVYGRPRSLDEVSQRIDAVTLDGLNAFVKSHVLPAKMDPGKTIVTVGPEALKVD